MNISARQFGEGVEVKVINKDSRITSIYQITERDAERLASDLLISLRELDRESRIKSLEAEQYAREA